ncbi:MAG: response regulator [Deltaproteobacteria bacterium]|nr:response regulator [Candidatus Zymogenaceae bacterium]
MKLSGSLEKNKLSDILREVKGESLTGILALKSQEGFGTIYFKDGVIINAYSPTFRERLGRRLIDKQHITEKDLRKVMIYQKTEGKNLRIGQILIQQGLVTEEVLNENLRELMEDALYTMVFWDGIYRFEASELKDQDINLMIDVDKFLDDIDKSFSKIEDDFLSVDIQAPPKRDKKPDKEHRDIKDEIIESIDNITRSISSFTPQEIVILVEDEKLMRTIFADGLKNFGYRVESFDNPTEALDRIKTLEPTRVSPILIMDLVMPGISSPTELYGGLELLSEINQNYPHIPVIVITSIADYEIRLKSLFLGSSYYLQKPEKARLSSDMLRSGLDQFVEELSFCVGNLLRNKRIHHEKEQLAIIREQLINELMDAKFELGSAEKEIERDIFDLTYLKKTTRDLLKKQSFAFIADTLIDFLRIDQKRGFIAILKRGELCFYRGFTNESGDNILKYNDKQDQYCIGFLELKPFEEVVSFNKIYTGKLSPEEGEVIKSFLGGYVPKSCFIIPFRVYEKTVAILYCDDEEQKNTFRNLDQIQILCNCASLAMQITILNEKIARKRHTG